MPNNSKITIKENVMSLVREGRAKMKPKWHFVLGSLAMIGGLTGLTILAVFTISLVSFSLRTHGPMGAIHLEQLLSTFPWGAIMVSAVGIGLGIWLLKKYDFSYKKNFPLIIGGFVLAILFAGWLINYTGLDSIWMHRGPMKEFYQRYDGGMMRGPGLRIRQEMIHEKGSSVMPFELNKTLHTFTKNESGGTQSVVVRDASDTADLSLIRMHLQMEVQNFSAGNFSDPTQLHGEDMPGVSTLSQNFRKMTVTYRELPNGAAIDFQSTNAETIAAIHAWFDAQLSDHGNDAASQ